MENMLIFGDVIASLDLFEVTQWKDIRLNAV